MRGASFWDVTPCSMGGALGRAYCPSSGLKKKPNKQQAEERHMILLHYMTHLRQQ
ncbi:hypothetical protein B7P43_G03967 [Cryptotermes secundus]|uniref:Uncharacterized protein n=1 Tax=Cryptotermes secundus TaxID=105785 RepID=A0A2J7RCN3_9NEOP|nr:hypothetical protein B7P43_G03967 [Cryptotermes secundus]